MELWTAFLIGLGGSLHCVGMCGPLALALPDGREGKLRLVAGRLLYNGGRILTYSLLGGLFGLVGGAVRMAGFQQLLSVVLGAGIALAALASLGPGRRVVLSVPLAARAIGVLKSALSRLLRFRSRYVLLLIGMLNGLLPCGFVYLGLAGSLTAGSLPGGMAYMALFGLGTVPLMLAVSLTGHLISAEVRQLGRRLLPVGMLALGVLFVLRGLGLGIPYVSPVLDGGMAGHHHGGH